MFNEKKEKTPQTTERNVIGKNTKIKGDIISEGDFRIDGIVEGTIKTDGRVIVGKSGDINGKIECANADFEGAFSGELIVQNLLTLKSTSKISGEVTIGKLSVEPGADFNATCSMRGSVKELKNGKQKEKTA